MIAVGANFFYSVTLPVTLWFLDRGKRGTDREDTVLFIDARGIFHQVDRAHRDFLPAQIELLANVVRLYRREEPETVDGSGAQTKELFPDGHYVDVPGLCRISTISEMRHKDGASTPVATPVPPSKRTTAKTSPRSLPDSTTNSQGCRITPPR